MGIFKKDLFDSIEDEETKVNSLLAHLYYLEKSKEHTLARMKKVKGTEKEKILEEKFKKLCQENEEVSEYIKNLEHKQKKQIEEKLKKIKEIK